MTDVGPGRGMDGRASGSPATTGRGDPVRGRRTLASKVRPKQNEAGSNGGTVEIEDLRPPVPLTTARELFGVAGRYEVDSLHVALKAAGVSLFPALVVGSLILAETTAMSAPSLQSDKIGLSVGLSSTALIGVANAAGLILALLAPPRLLLGTGRIRVMSNAALLISAGLAIMSIGSTIWVLSIGALLVGLAFGMTALTHAPFLFDNFPPPLRVRVLTIYTGCIVAGLALPPLMMVASDAALHMTWRLQFLILAVLPLAVGTMARRLNDVPVGNFDLSPLRTLIHDLGDNREKSNPELTTLGPILRFRQVLGNPTSPPILMMGAAFGFTTAALRRFAFIFLQDAWNVSPDRCLDLYLGMCATALGALVWYGKRAELAFRVSCGRLVQISCGALCISAGVLAIAVTVHVFAITVAGIAVGFGTAVLTLPTAVVLLLTVNRPENRSNASGLLAVFGFLIGAPVATQLMASVYVRYGSSWAFYIAALALLGLAKGGYKLAPRLDAAVDAVTEAVIEEEALAGAQAAGRHLPLLGVRHVDFSYGQLQVLFDVSFTVDDGEMVALLGTNGAGKSTLLRVISGLGIPSRGSIQFRGSEITYVGPDKRIELGITQIPGGGAVFGPLSVLDNLIVYGHARGRDRKSIEQGIESTFDTFPALAARKNELASTLSGGEQQMLALGKALILRPRVLLIDELSLGLAPKVVGELLTMVRSINAAGTAVVVVEQSVNVALSLVHHAYFMERGEMRFDGKASDLLARPDLLRSVFLEGANGRKANKP